MVDLKEYTKIIFLSLLLAYRISARRNKTTTNNIARRLWFDKSHFRGRPTPAPIYAQHRMCSLPVPRLYVLVSYVHVRVPYMYMNLGVHFTVSFLPFPYIWANERTRHANGGYVYVWCEAYQRTTETITRR